MTPYFLLADIAGRGWGGYVIEGMFGVLHRPFEQLWSSSAAGREERVLLTVGLHTANFSQLRDTPHIDPSRELQPQIALFCEVALEILKALPGTQADLVSALRENQLAGHSFDSYLASSVVDPDLKAKHLAFRHYLEDARPH